MSKIYYKTKKTSETGKKVRALRKKVIEINNQNTELEKKYNANSSYHDGDYLTGCIGFVFSENPDPKIWKKLKGVKDGFTPKISTAEGKRIKKEMKAITAIERAKLDECVGFNDVFNRMGFCVGKDCYGFILSSKWKHKMPDDCEEITYTEYQNL